MTEVHVPPSMNTKQAMEFLQIGSHETFNRIIKQHGIQPRFRSGRGNVYSGEEIYSIIQPTVDKRVDPFL